MLGNRPDAADADAIGDDSLDAPDLINFDTELRSLSAGEIEREPLCGGSCNAKPRCDEGALPTGRSLSRPTPAPLSTTRELGDRLLRDSGFVEADSATLPEGDNCRADPCLAGGGNERSFGDLGDFGDCGADLEDLAVPSANTGSSEGPGAKPKYRRTRLNSSAVSAFLKAGRGTISTFSPSAIFRFLKYSTSGMKTSGLKSMNVQPSASRGRVRYHSPLKSDARKVPLT